MYRRALADFENYRKRIDRDRARDAVSGKRDILLSVLDVLEGSIGRFRISRERTPLLPRGAGDPPAILVSAECGAWYPSCRKAAEYRRSNLTKVIIDHDEIRRWVEVLNTPQRSS